MSDEINNQNTDGNGNIMRELSTIKSTLAVATAETINIKVSISEIKTDIKEIKTNYINQEQHQTLVKCAEDHEKRIRFNEVSITRIMTFGTALILLIGIVEFIINKFF